MVCPATTATWWSFFNRQIMDTFTPSNWLLTNPEALHKAQETQGQSLVQGYEHFADDLRKAEVGRSAPETLEPPPLLSART